MQCTCANLSTISILYQHKFVNVHSVAFEASAPDAGIVVVLTAAAAIAVVDDRGVAFSVEVSNTSRQSAECRCRDILAGLSMRPTF